MENVQGNIPKHIAIIMDGNRRWARERGLEASKGHKQGAKTLENLAKYCSKIGIKHLTVYAFSTENWKRSKEEVGALMLLLKNYLAKFSKDVNKENIKIKILGDIETLEDGLKKSIKDAIERTKNNTGMIVNVALNYGGRAEITNAVKQIAEKIKQGELTTEQINDNVIEEHLYTAGQPDPDLLIRPGGELRISNFLPWQLVYSEFCFPEKYWPDFTEEDIDAAIKIYQQRNRKFGGK